MANAHRERDRIKRQAKRKEHSAKKRKRNEQAKRKAACKKRPKVTLAKKIIARVQQTIAGH